MSHATVSHFELPAADPRRAAAFYRRVFGWRLQATEFDGELYYRLRTGPPAAPRGEEHRGAIQGGIGRPALLGASQPLLVVHVGGEDLEVWLARIAAAGGEVVQRPTAIGKLGIYARFRDPEGNLLGLWQGAGEAG